MSNEIITQEATLNKKMIFDPVGFIVIFVDKKKNIIVAEHYSNVEKSGVEVATGKLQHIITGTSADKISHTIARLGIISRMDHAMYIGRELQKAERSIIDGTEYIQDK